ncbi:hypothetical protein SLE2022_222830 [Rubroshorea leprosula]
MEEENEGGGSQRSQTHIHNHYLWALASAAQFGWAISAYRRGYAGDHRLMPFKAFGVASLFIGASASAAVGSLQASGIQKVEDLVELGASIRNGLRIPKRTRDE